MTTGEGTQATAVRSGRFRIVAAEAHSWALLMLEDDCGGIHLHHLGTSATTEIPTEMAKSLFQSRTYRVWRGDRSWNALERLPVLDRVGTTPPAANLPFVSDTLSDNSQSA